MLSKGESKIKRRKKRVYFSAWAISSEPTRRKNRKGGDHHQIKVVPSMRTRGRREK